MSMHYCCDVRAKSATLLPNIAVMTAPVFECEDCGASYPGDVEACAECGSKDVYSRTAGARYWWACSLPGCVPDSDLSGPFDTENEALKDAREYVCSCEDEAEAAE